MPERRVVLVDMDGVIADFDSEVLRQLTESHPGANLDRPRPHFYIADNYPEYDREIRKIVHSQGFFLSLGLIDRAIEGWQRLLDLNWQPRVCTGPVRKNPFCRGEKMLWLRKHLVSEFGSSVVEEAVVVPQAEKYLIGGDVLIDDRPNVPSSNLAEWNQVLFDQECNRGVDLPRICGWLDPNLAEILETAAS